MRKWKVKNIQPKAKYNHQQDGKIKKYEVVKKIEKESFKENLTGW